MRTYEAANASRTEVPPFAGTEHGDRWTDLDYLLAAGFAAALIAPAPFFWAPPFWVLMLMSPVSRANQNPSGRVHLKREPTTSRPHLASGVRAANENQVIEERTIDLAA